MKSIVKSSALAVAILAAICSAGALSASPGNDRNQYAEGIYSDFALASDHEVVFETRTLARGPAKKLEGLPFADLIGEPHYRLEFEETRSSNIVAPTLAPLSGPVDRTELDGGVEGFDVVGLPVDKASYRLLSVRVTANGQSNEHRALEFCWNSLGHCVVYDPQIEFLDSVVNNYRQAKAEGYGPRIHEQPVHEQPVAAGDGVGIQAVCRLASNRNIIGRSLTWSSRTVTYKNVYGMTMVQKTLGGQQVGITCNSSCYPAMYGYSNASSGYGNLGYSVNCGRKHATGTSGRKGKAVSETKCAHKLTGSAKAEVTVKGTGSGIYLAWDTNGGVDGQGGSLTDTCGYF
ncbi:hypothetical protein [Marilutibacter alkalisoli]|uniref:Uncharacterized protein n=1 Tax=Marilutibacter alkalisoli TaxID=2591633 RepID=A0A514BRN4_9GAMM|nr:hypothetical protein [Lysobacter alkalisoli]QDH70030.1 hypothetical protein FKV23_07910 [Lysobacter alkalisoli]